MNARTASPLLSAGLTATASRTYEVVVEKAGVKNVSRVGLYSAVKEAVEAAEEVSASATVYCVEAAPAAGRRRAVAFANPGEDRCVRVASAADELERAVLAADWSLR